MIRVRNTLAILAFTALFGCAVDSPASTPTTEEVNITLHTTHVVQPLMRELTAHYLDIHTEFNIQLDNNSYGRLLEQLKNESIGYFVSSHVPVDSDIWAAPIARDGLVIIVHSDNPLKNLTLDEIREIFNGQQTRWQNQSSTSNIIIPLTYREDDDIYREFHHLIMGQQQITSNAQVVPNISAMIQQVTNTPQAIGYIPLSYINGNVSVLSVDDIMPSQATVEDNIYPLRTTLFVVGREEPPPLYRMFLSWVQSRDGQAIVSENYVMLP